jgi:hypothetical protein
MTTIYTTNRCLTVKESYENIRYWLQDDIQKVIELTEVINTYGEWGDKTHTNEKKVLFNKQHIIEVAGPVVAS